MIFTKCFVKPNISEYVYKTTVTLFSLIYEKMKYKLLNEFPALVLGLCRKLLWLKKEILKILKFNLILKITLT